MKWVKRTAGILAGIFLFTVIVRALNYMYVSKDDEWERIVWHSFYENKGKIDNLYLGSSHVYCDIDPYQLDELNGMRNFNLATPEQQMNGTYYLLREADRQNRLSHVYVELYYAVNVEKTFEDNQEWIATEVAPNWKNADYMRFSPNKLQYMLTMADVEMYPDIFFGFSRYRAHLGDWDYVRKTIERKRSGEYRNYQYCVEFGDGNGSDDYRQKGWCYSTRKFPGNGRLVGQSDGFKEEPMTETSETYLRKVIAYCQKKEVPVTLFVSPVYELALISTGNYDNYLAQVKGIAAEYDVDIYDFNLAGEQYLPIQDIRYFRDTGHLNAEGAGLFTEFFYKVVSGDANENRKYFYDSYEEKLAHATPEVYGICCSDELEEEGEIRYRSMCLASNRDEGMEYRIAMAPGNDKEAYLIQDFSENKVFKVDSNEHGTCTVTYRMQDAPDAVQTIEIAY